MRFVFIGFVLGAVWFYHPKSESEEITQVDKAKLERALENIK